VSSAPYCRPWTHMARFSSNTIAKFADDTVVVGLISGNNEKAYGEEVANLSFWCQDNRLMLNVSKTKELIVDFREPDSDYTHCHCGEEGEAAHSTLLRWRASLPGSATAPLRIGGLCRG